MLKRIKHFFNGDHKWREYVTTVPPTHPAFYRPALNQNEWKAICGFTEFVALCDCGTKRKTTLLGNLKKPLAPDEELEKLRKMAGI